jgi:hypothetical protein
MNNKTQYRILPENGINYLQYLSEDGFKLGKFQLETWNYIPSHKSPDKMFPKKCDKYVSDTNHNLLKFTKKYKMIDGYFHNKLYPLKKK